MNILKKLKSTKEKVLFNGSNFKRMEAPISRIYEKREVVEEQEAQIKNIQHKTSADFKRFQTTLRRY